jgi:ActD protein
MSTELKDIHDSHGADASTLDAGPRLTGLLGEFEDVSSVVTAAQKTRTAGYKVWDVHSPFPIHGIDAVIGIRPTILPWLVLCGGLTGLCTGLALQWFCNAYDYQLLVSGKPYFSLPANIPIIFECTVLFSALTTVFGMLGLNRLPLLYNPLFKSARFRRVTNDRFFIWIDETDSRFDEAKTEEFLKSVGATAVERIED